MVLYLAALSVACAVARGAPMPRHWHASSWWLRQALCIHQHESGDWYRRWTDYLGHRSPYAGGMQFLESTWLHAGGRGEPWQWPPREQLYRAWVVYLRDGRSWREWGTARACGLR